MFDTTTRPLTRPLRPEVDLLFCTARARMTAENADRVRVAARREVNWIKLVQLALQHETASPLYGNLQRICPESVPADVLNPLAVLRERQSAETGRRAEELVRILAALEDRKIPAIAYKGIVLSQRLYGDLSVREFSRRSDLDILIREGDLLAAQDVVLNEGYRLAFRDKVTEAAAYTRTHRELHFRRDGDGKRMLELKWRFMMPEACVRGDPKRFLRRVETIPFAGATVRTLPLEAYALVLSMHATKHKWGKLKLIGDIAEILESPDVDWEFVLREARQIGIRRMLAIGVLLAQDPLGAVVPRELARRLKIDPMTRALAMECRRGLLDPPGEKWFKEVDYKFLSGTRERLRDRARMYLKDRLLPRFTPDERDRRLIHVPACLSALYYFVRPMRLAWEKWPNARKNLAVLRPPGPPPHFPAS